jgi:hypothetical protein
VAENIPRRGRPRVDPDGPSTPLQVKLTSKDFHEAWQIARQRRESLRDLIRRGLKHEIEHSSR